MTWLIIVLGVLAVALLALRFIQFGLLFGSLAVAILWISDNGSAFVWFMILWAILFVAAIIASIMKRWGAATVTGVLAVVLVIIFGLATTIHGSSVSESAVNSAAPSPDTEETSEPEESEEALVCASSWEIRPPNTAEDRRLFSDGIASISTATDEATARLAYVDVVEEFKLVPVYLRALAATAIPSQYGSLTTEELIAGDCASDKAVEVYTELLVGAIEWEIGPDQADPNGYNTGVNSEGEVVAESDPGVRGDRTAIRITTKDGVTFWVLERCGNIVTPDKPGLPEGPTDNPPPPEEPDDSKSSNPDDYVYPDGKPSVGAPDGPAESTPRPVETSQPGGGGVVDTPTNPPSSETGVQAPGATPAPSTPRPVPPPEDGANTPVPDDPAAPPEGGNSDPIEEPVDW